MLWKICSGCHQLLSVYTSQVFFELNLGYRVYRPLLIVAAVCNFLFLATYRSDWWAVLCTSCACRNITSELRASSLQDWVSYTATILKGFIMLLACKSELNIDLPIYALIWGGHTLYELHLSPLIKLMITQMLCPYRVIELIGLNSCTVQNCIKITVDLTCNLYFFQSVLRGNGKTMPHFTVGLPHTKLLCFPKIDLTANCS